jgi:hypothetical protein
MMTIPEFGTLKRLAAFINANPKMGLRATVEQGYASTDRKISGTRLRRPGKGRKGSRIKIWDTQAKMPENHRSFGMVFGEHGLLLHDHNNAETYRRTSEVTSWLRNFLKGRRSP